MCVCVGDGDKYELQACTSNQLCLDLKSWSAPRGDAMPIMTCMVCVVW